MEKRPSPEIDSLKIKFEKLVKTKNPTGDPSCPPRVRRAKYIARNILRKVNPISARDQANEKPGSLGDIDETTGSSGGESVV